ncbi:MAG: DUF1002 domain-containing protein [Clostridia bacterium]|nr:DUF1002 domain-containing protein [Clostridia bacterium]
MKKTIAAMLCMIMVFALFVPAALAAGATDGDVCVVVGADLTQEQKESVYAYFGVPVGSVKELTVHIDEERACLGDRVPAEQIGSRSISCIYIRVRKPGDGINVQTNNITWCTSEMYKNALITAGITDADVMITAPFAVSGTAALTGIYKAYEDVTGTALQEEAKDASTEELVVTGTLAETLGDEQATELINQLKLILDETKTMSDDEVRSEIVRIAEDLGYSLTDGQVEQILNLIRKWEKLDINELKKAVDNAIGTLQTINQVNQNVTSFDQKVRDFFSRIGDFFSGLFGGSKN